MNVPKLLHWEGGITAVRTLREQPSKADPSAPSQA